MADAIIYALYDVNKCVWAGKPRHGVTGVHKWKSTRAAHDLAHARFFCDIGTAKRAVPHYNQHGYNFVIISLAVEKTQVYTP
jgi:hypothetical protein